MINVINERLAEIISFSTADETEALIGISDNSLTRFSNNVIHQNISQKDITVLIRVALGKKIGVVNVNKLDKHLLKQAVDKAIEIAKAVPEKSDFYGLPENVVPQYKIKRFDSKTGDFNADKRADIVKEITAIAKELNASGAVENGINILGIANSKGINKTQTVTDASYNLVVSSKTGAGYASAIESAIGKIDFRSLTKKAVEKALKSEKPVELKTGKYKVFLEPYAISEMLSHLNYSGMGALSVQEGRSFLSGNLGKKIMDDRITIYDDASNKNMIGFGFDYEGVTKQRVNIIENGIAKGPVYDTSTAVKEGKKSTGHALPASSSHGPLPLNLILKHENNDPSDLLDDIDKGIYVSRFHYTNLEHPVKTILTGMTRDGTFLIENGKITKPVNNMRFTQSIVEAFNNIIKIGNDLRLVDSMVGVSLVPSITMDNFNFTSLTEF